MGTVDWPINYLVFKSDTVLLDQIQEAEKLVLVSIFWDVWRDYAYQLAVGPSTLAAFGIVLGHCRSWFETRIQGDEVLCKLVDQRSSASRMLSELRKKKMYWCWSKEGNARI